MAVHVGDIGTSLQLNLVDENGTAIDVSAATTKSIVLLSPGGTASTKTAAFVTDGTNGQIRYVTTAAADLNEAGTWKMQASIVVTSALTFKSDAAVFIVAANLS